jgi:uncharacterized PurR-regulated membrane protein YhhQ (DUF165 family)
MQPEFNQFSSNVRAITRAEQAFVVLGSVFIASLVITNLISGKYFVVLGMPLSCGVIIYPVNFLLTNILAEVYGIKRIRM